MPNEQPKYPKEIDKLKAYLGLSFALFLISKFVAAVYGHDSPQRARDADALVTVCGLLIIVLLARLVVRTVLRRQRTATLQDVLPRSAFMSQHGPLAMILLGVGVGLLGFIFGEPANSFAVSFRQQLADTRIFGIEALQYKWVLAGSVCLVLIGIFLYSVQKGPSSK